MQSGSMSWWDMNLLISLVFHLWTILKKKKKKKQTCALCSSLLCFPSVQQRGIYPDHALSW